MENTSFSPTVRHEFIDYILGYINEFENLVYVSSLENIIKQKFHNQFVFVESTLCIMHKMGLIIYHNKDEKPYVELNVFGYECMEYGGYIKYLEWTHNKAINEYTLLSLQIESNKSAIQTNKNTRSTNRTLIWIFGLTFIATVGSLVINLLNYIRDTNLQQQDTLLKLKDRQLQALHYKDTVK